MHKTLRKLPSLDFLRGFEAAGRLASITRAADELFLTQSALSRQVKALEDALGVALFERKHRAIALTAAGFAVYLITLQAFVIDAWCIWCLVNDLVVVPLLAVLTVWRVRRMSA